VTGGTPQSGPAPKLGSYASNSHGLSIFVREIASLYKLYTANCADRVDEQLRDAQRVERWLEERYSEKIRNLDVLEVGPGPFAAQLKYFSLKNRVTGIDRDVMPFGLNPVPYVRMLASNGLRRTLKTVGRKVIGTDRRFAEELKRQLGVPRLARIDVIPMDVCAMSFQAGSFDFVYSRSVLHCLPDPGVALRELARVLRPGGLAYMSLQPYSSATGCLDPRIHTNRQHEVAGWPHLRPRLRGGLYPPNVFLNELRLDAWHAIFAREMPGSECVIVPNTDARVRLEAAQLQAKGELAAYTQDELLAGELVAMWHKPQPGRARRSTES
jgi:SAM-dependent methyltransferase